MRALITILVLSLCSIQLCAEQVSLKQSSYQVLDRLLLGGSSKLYDLDLAKLRDGLNAISFRSYSGDFPPEAKNRRTAFYKHGKVYSPGKFSARFIDAIELLAIHETLGASGFNDEDYQRSVVLHYLSKIKGQPKKNLLDDLQIRLMFTQDELLIKQGGVTSVGGGGDLAAAWYKAQLVDYAVKNPSSLLYTLGFIEIAWLAIEPESVGRVTTLRYQASNAAFAERFDNLTVREYQRTGRRGTLSMDFVIEVPKSDRATVVKNVSKDLLAFVESRLHSPREIVSECGAFSLSLPKGFSSLEIVKNSGGVKEIIKSFKEQCRNVLK